MKISKTYVFDQLLPEKLYKWGLYVLQEIATKNIKENIQNTGFFSKQISGVAFNYMKISFKVFEEEGTTKACLTGEDLGIAGRYLKPEYISSRLLDEFLSRLSEKLQNIENYSFPFVPIMQSHPQYSVSASDVVFVWVLLGVLIGSYVVGSLFGKSTLSSFVLIVALLIGVYGIVDAYRGGKSKVR